MPAHQVLNDRTIYEPCLPDGSGHNDCIARAEDMKPCDCTCHLGVIVTTNAPPGTRTPQAFAHLIASMSIEGECIEHGHNPDECPDDDGEGSAGNDPNCCDIGVYEPTGSDAAETLDNLIATARTIKGNTEA